MSSPLPDVFLNSAANALKTPFTHVGLLDGTTTELAGGSPAYARQPLVYGATAGGDWTGTASFAIPPGSTVAKVGFYTAGSGGSRVHVDDLDAPEVFAGQGQLDLTVYGDAD